MADGHCHQNKGRSVATSQRVGGLDALRGLAAFGVMAFHYSTHCGREIGHATEPAFGFP
jgi:peptidoglycan/LPS O-acetylase OafA/YrhL